MFDDYIKITGHSVGAKLLPLPTNVLSSAIYGGINNCYRYRLEWALPKHNKTIFWLMMNPSVASEMGGDRTVHKCWRYSTSWNFDRMLIGNSAAYRATDQARLAEIDDPVGEENHYHILEMAKMADMIVVAYGSPKVKSAKNYGIDAANILKDYPLHVLELSNSGIPKHPLYLDSSLLPKRWII